MRTLKRNMLIFLSPAMEEGRYRVFDSTGNTVFESGEDYHIYFTDVKFGDNGYTSATYLGETDGKLLDEYCKEVKFCNRAGWMTEDGIKPSAARLASVHNGQGLVIIQ